MSDGMYVAMSAATARLAQLDTIADNLANAETPGFKSAHPAYQSFEIDADAAGIHDQVHTAVVATGVDLRPGRLATTGRPLDIVPEGNSFFGVRNSDGQVAYTRRGSVQVDALGQLNIGGQALMSESGNVFAVPPGVVPLIAPDGTVSAGGANFGRIAQFQLNGAVTRLGGSLVGAADGSVAQVSGNVNVGELEMSNADPMRLTVDLISVQRQYENAMQALQTYKTIDERAVQVALVR